MNKDLFAKLDFSLDNYEVISQMKEFSLEKARDALKEWEELDIDEDIYLSLEKLNKIEQFENLAKENKK